MILLLASCALTTLFTKGKSHPQIDGELVMRVSDPVTIRRDVRGVPHIEAKAPADAAYAMGVIHAQDRLFQIDLQRRVIQGGLSAWFGEATGDHDAFMRAMDLRSQAERAYDAARPEVRDLLDAYARGVNDGAGLNKHLPVEYRLLDRNFESWTPIDSLTIAHLNSWGLATNATTEQAILQLRGKLSAEQAEALFHTDPRSVPLDGFYDELADLDIGPFTGEFSAFNGILGGARHAEASNNWLVTGAKSTNGKPIVANDPHLGQGVPSLWHFVEVDADGLHVSGATFPGLPTVLIGHNDRIAWGLTNTMADYVDLAVVKLDDHGYVRGGRHRPFERVVVEVPVRDGPSTRHTVHMTDVGPLITARDHDYGVVLQWHALDLEDHSAEIFYSLAMAEDVPSALKSVEALPAVVSQNLVVGDVDGNTAWQVIGTVVERKAHTGRMPYPAWKASHGWAGTYAVSELPGVRDPAAGYVLTANARPDHPLADAISTRYVPPWRHARIDAMLSEAEQFSPEDLAAQQLDLYDMHAAATVPGLLEGIEDCAGLGEWDFVARASGKHTATFAMLQQELVLLALDDELGREGALIYLDAKSPGSTLIDAGVLAKFVDDDKAARQEAMNRTCARLDAQPGVTWGDLHPFTLKHPFSRRSKILGKFGFDVGVLAFSGTPNTVNVGGYGLDDETGFDTGGVPSLRIVMPLADLSKTTFVHPGGQSGQPGFRNYGDLLDAYAAGEQVPLHEPGGVVLTLTPDARVRALLRDSRR